jgi:hypothetical protein
MMTIKNLQKVKDRHKIKDIYLNCKRDMRNKSSAMQQQQQSKTNIIHFQALFAKLRKATTSFVMSVRPSA